MNFITIGIGLLPCSYAIVVLILRLVGQDNMFGKLGLMRRKWGNTVGSILHYIGYVVVPFCIGISIIYFGILGYSITDWLSA